MTFDDANDIVMGAKHWDLTQEEYEAFSDPVTRGAVKKILAHLRETYAKPVKMTQEEYNNLAKVKEMDTSQMANSLFDVATFTEEIGEPYEDSIGNFLRSKALNDESLMRAWLFPEVIEVEE